MDDSAGYGGGFAGTDETVARQRVDSCATAAFVLSVSMLHDLVTEGLITRDRAARIVEQAITTLRRLYGVSPEEGQAAFDGHVFDYRKLSDLISRQQHARPAEDLLRSILDPLLDREAGGRR